MQFVTLIFLIVLAAFGVGLTGVAPTSSFKRNSKLSETIKIEKLDEREKKKRKEAELKF